MATKKQGGGGVVGQNFKRGESNAGEVRNTLPTVRDSHVRKSILDMLRNASLKNFF